jgi:hypothetical protein
MGIKRLHDPEGVWQAIAELDAREAFHERSAFHLLEQFVPGDVFHVDSLVVGGQVVFASVERYGAPPFEVSHFGGVPISYTVKHGSPEQRALLKLNRKLLDGFGYKQGVTHAEFIHHPECRQYANPSGGVSTTEVGTAGKSAAANFSIAGSSGTDQFKFLEVAARVGGAYTADTIAAATGVNLWREWARIELATPERPYVLPPLRKEYGGIAVSLAREEYPCTSRYDDPEIVFRVRKPWHVGLVIRSPDYARVINLLTGYARRFSEDFTAVAPAEETPEQHL